MRGCWAETLRRVSIEAEVSEDVDGPVLSFFAYGVPLASRLAFDRYDLAFAEALATLPVHLRLQGESASDGSVTAVLGAVIDFGGHPARPSADLVDHDPVAYPLGTLWRGRVDRTYPSNDLAELADMLESLLQLPVRTEDQMAVESLLASV